MSEQVTAHFVQHYTTNVQLLSQQRNSRFRNTVSVGAYIGSQAQVVDQFVPTTAKKRTTRYPDLTPAETQGDSRWVFPFDYDWNDLIDNIDKLRLLIDPTSSYAVNAASAMNRAIDIEIINAFFGTAKTGIGGATSTVFLAANQVSASEGASAATGMNVEKLKAGIQLLLANEAWAPDSGDMIYCGITAKQNRNLMDEIQIINADYNGETMVANAGFVSAWGPIQFIHSEQLPLNVSSQTRCPLYVKAGMHLGLWNDVQTDISQLKTKAGLPWQVYVYGTFGGTRVEEKKVVELPCA